MALTVLKSFDHDNKKLQVYGTTEEPLFMAQQVGEFLNMSNIRVVLREIPDDWKIIKNNSVSNSYGIKKAGNPNKVFIKEPALYKIAFRSNKKEADEFTNWVASEVLPSIRKTGQYVAPERKQIKTRTVFKIETENDLHHKTVNFVKNLPYDLVINAGLGELQDTENKRIDAFQKGYMKGQPDLLILNPTSKYAGLAIEFKAPKGTGQTSEYQFDLLDKYRKIGYKVINSNSYDDIIMCIHDYVLDLRIVCKYCPNKFKNNVTLANHLKYFHKIIKNA